MAGKLKEVDIESDKDRRKKDTLEVLERVRLEVESGEYTGLIIMAETADGKVVTEASYCEDAYAFVGRMMEMVILRLGLVRK